MTKVAEIDAESWKKWLGPLMSRPGKGGEPPEPGKASRGLILLVLIGIVLMLLGDRLGSDRAADETTDRAVPSNAPPTAAVAPVAAAPAGSLERLERALAAAISEIVGVGNADVLIVAKGSERQVFAEEITQRTSLTQSPGQGGAGRLETREESITRRPVIYRGEDGRTERPLVSHTEAPEIAGVLVTAVGADDPTVRLLLLQAVSTVLDLPAHRVQVVARKR